MTHRRPLLRRLPAALLALPLCFTLADAAHADVFGRLRVVVRNVAGTPVPGAIVTFHDTVGVEPDVRVTAAAGGVALSPPLENHPWRITTQVVTFGTDTRVVSVTADTSTEVDIALAKSIISSKGRGVTILREIKPPLPRSGPCNSTKPFRRPAQTRRTFSACS